MGQTLPTPRLVRSDLLFATIPLLILVILAAMFAAIDQRIVSIGSVRIVLVQATPIALLALGAFVVLLTGGIDLSAGAGVALCAVIMGGVLASGLPLPLALVAGLLAMTVLGLANGFLTGYLGVPAFVTTLATMVAAQGATLIAASKGVLLITSPTLKNFGTSTVVGVPVTLLAVAAVALAMHGLMRHTALGLRTYAVGSKAEAAQLAGVPIPRQLLLAYLIGAVFTFLTAALIISRVPVITPNVAGTSLLLDAIAAAVIGGTSIQGGRGTVFGVVVGAIIVSLLTNALRIFGVDPSSIDLYKGVIIAGALALDAGLNLYRGHLVQGPAR